MRDTAVREARIEPCKVKVTVIFAVGGKAGSRRTKKRVKKRKEGKRF